MKVKQKKALFFDCDGTLVDSIDSLARVHGELVRQFGKTLEVTPALIRSNWSQGWQKLYADTYGMNREEIALSTPVFRTLAREHFKSSRPFKGIDEALKKLSKTHALYVVSENYSDIVANSLILGGLVNYFSRIYGYESLQGMSKSDPRFFLTPADELNLEKEHITVIGDTVGDIVGAKKGGLRVIACSWGYQDRELLVEAKPDYLADSPEELLDIIQQA